MSHKYINQSKKIKANSNCKVDFSKYSIFSKVYINFLFYLIIFFYPKVNQPPLTAMIIEFIIYE